MATTTTNESQKTANAPQTLRPEDVKVTRGVNTADVPAASRGKVDPDIKEAAVDSHRDMK